MYPAAKKRYTKLLNRYLLLSGIKRMKRSTVIIADLAINKKLYDRHEWPRSSHRRWQVRYGRDRRGKSEVGSRGPHQESSVSPGCRGWTLSKLQPVDSYELPKVRYAVLSPTPSLSRLAPCTDPCSSSGSLTSQVNR